MGDYAWIVEGIAALLFAPFALLVTARVGLDLIRELL